MNFIIPLVIYPYDIMVSVDECPDKLLKTLSKYNFSKEELKTCGVNKEIKLGRTCIFESGQILIRMHHSDNIPQYISNIAHEAYHAVNFFMNEIGDSFEIGTSDESYAYLLGYIVEEITKKVIKI